MHGSRITAAGVIKVKHGQLRSLAPLSGHYRPPAQNFKSFVHSLEEEGCDMRRVNISKSYAILIGMEKYTKTKKKFDGAVGALGHTKDKVLHPEKVKAEEEARRDKSESAERERMWLQQQRQKMGGGEGKKEKGTGGLVKRLTGKFRIGGSKKESNVTAAKLPEMAERDQRVPGTGPEDGVPAPEGAR
jgi:hypothetical protein